MLMRAGTAGVPTISEWLTDVLSPGSNVGIDPVSLIGRYFTTECRGKILSIICMSE